ncbi:zinc finger protein 2 homolog [Drosophila grimshawi]|uniref:GH24099 n=1 Tax=Drosophila grimshawi TaxID=7222 RepID=B4JNQ1_DROGR|nr:zinc finger protein 2 homolog [Drosophila grimshawi]EDV92344.1 GH24099 [Drosophila grimshawi]
MLKQCLINVDLSRLHAKQQLRPKCGEIFYERDNEYSSFQLVCCLCEMKHFAFDDFSLHIRNVHFDKQGKPRTQTSKAPAGSNQDALQQQRQLHLVNSSPTPLIEFSANDCHKFVSKDMSDDDADDDNDNDDDDDDVDGLKALRVCSFKEIELATNENAQCDAESSHSDDEVEEAVTADSHIFSDADYHDDDNEDDDNDIDDDDDDGNSEIGRQSVFKKERQPKDYKCKYCEGKYTTLKYLNIHLKLSHPHPQGFKCSDCDATFDVDRALETHRRKVHTEFTCNMCDKVYKSSRTLLRHVQGHSGLRQFKCEHENCGKSFVSQHNLTSHRRVHSTDRNYVCELCGYRSRYRFALVVHRRTHTGEKPFKCQTCSRCFASKSLLNEHQAMHSTERPFKCDKCAAAFSRPKALYHHKHLHLGIKKFKCKICGKAYAQAAGLSAHMRGHKIQTVNGIADGVTTTAATSSSTRY